MPENPDKETRQIEKLLEIHTSPRSKEEVKRAQQIQARRLRQGAPTKPGRKAKTAGEREREAQQTVLASVNGTALKEEKEYFGDEFPGVLKEVDELIAWWEYLLTRWEHKGERAETCIYQKTAFRLFRELEEYSRATGEAVDPKVFVTALFIDRQQLAKKFPGGPIAKETVPRTTIQNLISEKAFAAYYRTRNEALALVHGIVLYTPPTPEQEFREQARLIVSYNDPFLMDAQRRLYHNLPQGERRRVGVEQFCPTEVGYLPQSQVCQGCYFRAQCEEIALKHLPYQLFFARSELTPEQAARLYLIYHHHKKEARTEGERLFAAGYRDARSFCLNSDLFRKALNG